MSIFNSLQIFFLTVPSAEDTARSTVVRAKEMLHADDFDEHVFDKPALEVYRELVLVRDAEPDLQLQRSCLRMMSGVPMPFRESIAVA